MRSTDILAIGDRVLPGRYVHPQRFDHAVNFFRGRRVISLVSERIGAGPTNVVIAHRAWPAWRSAGDALCISHSRIQLGRHVASRRRVPICVSRIPRLVLEMVPDAPDCPPAAQARRREKKSSQHVWPERQQFVRWLRLALHRIEKLLEREAPAMSLASVDRARQTGDAFRNACLAYQRRHIGALLRHFPPRQSTPPQAALDAARALAGSGIGATPAGDDFLAGVLLALHASERTLCVRHRAWIRSLRAAAQTTNLLSAHFLTMAAGGYASNDMRHLVMALHHRNEEELDSCVRAVLKHGHTSGADLLAGFVQTLKKLVLSRGVAHGHQKRNS